MNFAFNIGAIEDSVVEFGVGRRLVGDNVDLKAVPIDARVKVELRDIARIRLEQMSKIENPMDYEVANDYPDGVCLVLPAASPLALPLMDIHRAVNLPTDPNMLADLGSVFCYFTYYTDEQGQRLTGVRRTAQFKGLRKKRLVAFLGNELRYVDDVFEINNDFDVLIDSNFVHIINPKSFRFLVKIEQSIIEAIPQNISVIQQRMPYVDWSSVETYAVTHSRSASLLASISTGNLAVNVDKDSLIDLCTKTGVVVSEFNGTINVPENQVRGFLEVLDRRRYEVSLVPQSPETFRATNRQRIP